MTGVPLGPDTELRVEILRALEQLGQVIGQRGIPR